MCVFLFTVFYGDTFLPDKYLGSFARNMNIPVCTSLCKVFVTVATSK